MTINDFYDEYFSLTEERKREGISKLIQLCQETFTNIDDPFWLEFLELCMREEDDDGFGTEGANI